MSDGGRLVGCTIVSKNYIAYARVWAASFRRHHPEARAVVLLADRLEGAFDAATEPFELIEVESLGIPDVLQMAFRYNVLEFNTSLKPAFLAHLLKQTSAGGKVLYFDPDIEVFAPVTPVLEALETSNIVLTPHTLSPLPSDGFSPSEVAFLISGTYNLGFIGLTASDETRRFLGWWHEHLREGGLSAPERGLFTDQKWIDLVPGMFDGVTILRNRTLNAAYWNLHERRDLTAGEDGSYRLGPEPLRFFHFSGFVADRPDIISKYQSRYRLSELGRVYGHLFTGYKRALKAAGLEEAREFPYAFGRFDNGEPVLGEMRRLFGSERGTGERWPDPFVSGSGSFFAWMLDPPGPFTPLPPLARAIYDHRPDVAAAFPDGCGSEARKVIEWLIADGAQEHGLGAISVERFRATFEALGRDEEALMEPPPQGPDVTQAGPPSPADDDPGVENTALYAAPPRQAWKRAAQTVVGADLYRRMRLRYWNWLAGAAPPRSSLEPAERSATVTQPVDRPFGVNLFGYLDTESGIGEVARSFAHTLRRAGIPLALVNVEQSWLRRGDKSIQRFSTANPYAINLFFLNADQLPSFAAANREALVGRRNIGYWFWELESFPKAFFPAFGNVDEVWVASTFCQEAIGAAAPVPVHRIPPEIHPEDWPAPDRARFGIDTKDLVFGFVFDSASQVRRKNPGAVVSAFRAAFPRPGRELLVIKTTRAAPAVAGALERLAGASRIRILDGYMDRRDLLSLIGSIDCYVSLHRSEGLGLTILEAMAYGKPSIATAYGGSADFVGPNVGYPIPFRRVPLRRPAGPYPADAIWAEPSVSAAAEAMRAVASDPAGAERLGEAARTWLTREWASGTETKMIERLEVGRRRKA